MIHPEPVWRSIDRIAKDQGLSLPRLAQKADLDLSTLNPVRRKPRDGKESWPSLKTIVKILNRSEISLVEWAKMVERDGESNSGTTAQ